ncbi:MAG: hypothetical protein PUB13_07055 [Lachnospiraceae bacterium]|nr:hypothetical protein [Lachnospiraceae bacterium]
MSRIEEKYKPALSGKKIPIVTLDHKWHRIFAKVDKPESIIQKEEELNELLRRQGKYNTETKDIRKLKKKMMDEIVKLMEENDSASEKKIEDNKRLINECNEKIEEYQDKLLELPKEIKRVNEELMLETMDICYDAMHRNERQIREITDWVRDIRIELKKNIVRKQEMEIANEELYSYLHNIFGADVIDMFDMKYNPMDHPVKPAANNSEKPESEKENK